MIRTSVLVGLSLLLLAALAPAADWAETIARVERALVYLNTDEASCSAFVIHSQKRYLLTAAHCASKEIWVDGVRGEIIFKDTKKDLLVLEAKHLADRPALKLAPKNPARGEQVMAAGYGYALERPFFRLSHVQDDQFTLPEGGIGGPYVSTDAPFVAGQSGGPVVNAKGEVVAIVQRASDTVGIGVGAEILRARTGRFWESETPRE